MQDGSLACRGTVKDCGDGNLCTQDLCDPATGQCGNPAVDCNDGNSCTSDSCDPATGACVRTPLSGTCSDGNPCTTADFCSGGNCLAGPPRNCDDLFFCTRDSCVVDLGGCQHVPDDSLCPPNSPCATWVCNLSNLPGSLGGCSNVLPLRFLRSGILPGVLQQHESVRRPQRLHGQRSVRRRSLQRDAPVRRRQSLYLRFLRSSDRSLWAHQQHRSMQRRQPMHGGRRLQRRDLPERNASELRRRQRLHG
ncbi:MAG: hypothetical protein DMH00_02810 [Acidobacteria bacterium]|nr:MAG: hypothetical protein DMH00_02810 [Acidobacteriota bacterium]